MQLLQRIFVYNMFHKLFKQVTISISSSPEALHHVAGKQVRRCVHNALLSHHPLRARPVSLDGLCVSSCDGVNKVLAVVDRFVGVSTRDGPDVVVGSPLIRNDCCPRPDVLLDDGQ